MLLDPGSLLGRWTHSHEEDAPGTLVYRRSDRPFPASRGRRSFDLLAGGALLSGGPGPDDRRRAAAGRWRLLPDDTLELDEPSGRTRFHIIEVTGDRLVLQRS